MPKPKAVTTQGDSRPDASLRLVHRSSLPSLGNPPTVLSPHTATRGHAGRPLYARASKLAILNPRQPPKNMGNTIKSKSGQGEPGINLRVPAGESWRSIRGRAPGGAAYTARSFPRFFAAVSFEIPTTSPPRSGQPNRAQPQGRAFVLILDVLPAQNALNRPRKVARGWRRQVVLFDQKRVIRRVAPDRQEKI